MKKRISKMLIAVLCIFALLGVTGCGQKTEQKVADNGGGTLYLKVNPDIAVNYDKDGNVTKLEGRNDDGQKILKDYTGYEGKECRTVVNELVSKIGAAGYFVEDVDGKGRQIVIEIEKGSKLPSETFMDEIVTDVRTNVSANHWKSPVEVQGESDYGITDYVDTDYGPANDGDTDYDDTDYVPNNDGVTDYDDTDYGPNNDGVTDYDDTDYGPNNDGVTDYDDTDYGPNNDGVTDYDDTDYGPNNDGVTDYDDTDYGPNNDGVTDYDDTDYGTNNDGATDYNDTNYGSDGDTDYDDNNDN